MAFHSDQTLWKQGRAELPSSEPAVGRSIQWRPTAGDREGNVAFVGRPERAKCCLPRFYSYRLRRRRPSARERASQRTSLRDGISLTTCVVAACTAILILRSIVILFDQVIQWYKKTVAVSVSARDRDIARVTDARCPKRIFVFVGERRLLLNSAITSDVPGLLRLRSCCPGTVRGLFAKL